MRGTRRRWARRRFAVPAALVLATATAGCGSGVVQDQLAFSPAPGTPVASPGTQITVRGATAAQLQGLTVTGSRSGRHAGTIVTDSAGRDATFLPDTRFAPGETVSVSLRVSGKRRRIRFRFGVARSVPATIYAGPPAKPTRPGQVQQFHSRPDLRPPTISVSERSEATSAGDIFLGPANKLGQAGPLIADDEGQLIWFHPLPGKLQAFGFREQRYQGEPVLTWWQGVVSTFGFGQGEDVIYDTSYHPIATIHAAEGYYADLHDFVITPQGTALITAYNPVREDLSAEGGSREGTILDCVIQELDIKTGRVLFEWHSLGHVGIDESHFKPAKNQLFDYFHLNSVAVDTDGNLIISARNTWTIYKIDRRTGQIMWRLGGRRSTFKMGPGTEFAYQHDAEPQPDGTVTVFDNGANPQVHPESRAIAVGLSLKTRTASLVYEWKHPSKILATSQGNVQTLPNGDRFVGWGGDPNLTEFSPDGRVLFNAAMARPDTSYRAYRFVWNGTAPGRPAVAAMSARDGKLVVYVSWNGATNVARWRILGGSAPDALAPVAEAGRTGFETKTLVSTGARYIAVEAQSASGRVLGTSEVVRRG
jgi:hypothetical protein